MKIGSRRTYSMFNIVRLIISSFIFRDNLPGYEEYTDMIDPLDIKRWGQDQRNSVEITDDVKDHFCEYMGRGSKRINGYLLCGKYKSGNDPETEKIIEEFDEVLQRASIDDNIVVYHAMKREHLPEDENDNIVPNCYWSTSLLLAADYIFKDNENYNCILRIFLPKGTHALYISDIKGRDFLNEYELLLPRKCKFKVIKRHLFSKYLDVVLIDDGIK